MKRRILIAGLITGLICGVGALAADSGRELYQKAVALETGPGKLEEAITLYQRVAKEFASDRPLAARALMAAASCYERLGQNKAVKIYEQVAREFGDQRESAQTASRRLAALRHAAPAPVTRKLTKFEPLGEPTVFGPQTYTDGQHAVYQDATHALVIGDLDGGNKQVVYKPKAGESVAFIPSRDLSMVALLLFTPGQPTKQAVIKIDRTGYHELFQGHPYGGAPPA